MSVSFPILLAAAACAAAISAALYFALQGARKRAGARGPIALDLGGRLPSKRRRPCGRHGEGGGNCDDCEHKHEHHDHGGAGGGNRVLQGGHCARGHCQE